MKVRGSLLFLSVLEPTCGFGRRVKSHRYLFAWQAGLLLYLPDRFLEAECLLTGGAENRRFIDAIIKGRKRFEALRDFTVEGALAEVDRMTMERKDAGESIRISGAARNSSVDSARSQGFGRSPSLGNVPEDSTFTIGDDDDEDGLESTTDSHDSRPVSASNSAVEDALPLQSRSMSEKARGKQPIGQGNFSRSTSRNNSTTSLPSLTTVPSHSQQFTPTLQWVCLTCTISKRLRKSKHADTRYRSSTPGYHTCICTPSSQPSKMPNCQIPKEPRPSTPPSCPPAPPNTPNRPGEVTPKAPKPPKKVRFALASLDDL